jgi:MerC mercury resistance protein
MFKKWNWDAIGIGASLACAIHCALLPLFFSSLPLMGINILHNTQFELGMIFFIPWVQKTSSFLYTHTIVFLGYSYHVK